MLLAAQIQTIPNLPGPLGGDSAGAPVVKIELAPQFQPAAVGQSLTLAVVLTVPEGWHLYANPKQGEFGKDTRIIPQPVKGARFGNIIYDPGKKYVDANFKASNQIYEGAVVCYVPLEVAADAPPEGVISIQLKLDGLLCSDAGQCRPWQEQAVLDLRLTARSEQAQMQRPKLFEKINLPQAWRDSTAQIEPSARPVGTTTAKEDIQFASDERSAERRASGS